MRDELGEESVDGADEGAQGEFASGTARFGAARREVVVAASRGEFAKSERFGLSDLA